MRTDVEKRGEEKSGGGRSGRWLAAQKGLMHHLRRNIEQHQSLFIRFGLLSKKGMGFSEPVFGYLVPGYGRLAFETRGGESLKTHFFLPCLPLRTVATYPAPFPRD